MSATAPKPTAVATSPPHYTGRHADPVPPDGEAGYEGADALIETIRASLMWAGLAESHSDVEEGFFFSLGIDEISVHYNQVRAVAEPAPMTVSRRIEMAFLQCCRELAASDYAFTLYASPRTVALHITLD